MDPVSCLAGVLVLVGRDGDEHPANTATAKTADNQKTLFISTAPSCSSGPQAVIDVRARWRELEHDLVARGTADEDASPPSPVTLRNLVVEQL
jgi:hypothetical protein